MLVTPGLRTHLLGPILALEAVTEKDAGVYRCTASNVGGEASAEPRLVVTTPFHVEVSPSVLSVHIGGTAEFKCNVHSEVSFPDAVSDSDEKSGQKSFYFYYFLRN